ncbi:MAG: hypothetical protein Q9162_006671 [Coniocarpon cinnabarinum]
MFKRSHQSRRSHRSARNSVDQSAAAMEMSRMPGDSITTPPHRDMDEKPRHEHTLPHMNLQYHRHPKTKGIKHAGESGRSWIHPWHFTRICFRSSCTLSMMVNVLWPVVPAAIAVHFALPEHHTLIFTLAYIAMVPAANLIGFAGQELARKLNPVFGVLLETTLGSIVELILLITLIVKHHQHQNDPTNNAEITITVIRAAILGSILANLLLCLGLCFISGGIMHEEQVFHEAISEVGSNLLLVAGFALVVPVAFVASLPGTNARTLSDLGTLEDPNAEHLVTSISRAAAVMLLVAFLIYTFFQTTSHHSVYKDLIEADEQRDKDRDKDLAKAKLTLSECVLALVIAITIVSMMAVFLVLEIEPIVHENGVPDAFMGLILVPLVEKAAEHLTAVDEAWDNQANLALTHVLGSCIQTALLNTPLVIIVGWGLGTDMDLNFRPFEAIVLILAIIVVGNFLRDGKSNYLEGALCVITYVVIAVAAYYTPNPNSSEGIGASGEGTATGEAGAAETSPAAEVATHAAKLLIRSVIH